MAYDIPHLRDLDRLLPATRTTRPDIARSHLAAVFADHDLRLSAGRVDFSHRQASLCDTSVGMLRYGTEVEVVAPALDCYVAQLTLDGEVAFRTERFEIALKPGTLFVMNPGLRYRKTWSRDAHQLMIKIPRQRLAAHTTRPVRFAPIVSQMGEADGLIGLIAHRVLYRYISLVILDCRRRHAVAWCARRSRCVQRASVSSRREC